MEKILVIAEKPDMGRHIAAAIEPRSKNKKTHIEGEKYIFSWAIGHLVGLAEPDKYDNKYKKWKFTDLPIIPTTFRLTPIYRTKKQLDVLLELSKKCSRIINACDAGREGQLIFAYIQKYLKLRQPVQRLWISDLTDETIRKGFQTLRDEQEYSYLTKAAIARSEADWLIGMNGSRAFTTKHQTLLSVGRVQTPVLAMIFDRQKEIESFVSTKYYQVHATFSQDDQTYEGVWQGSKIEDPTEAERIVKKVTGEVGTITAYEKKESKEWPLKLYDLTLLQREANAKFGFSAKKTLDIAQLLYEKHKVISYPRTNSNYVTEQNIFDMHKVLDSLQSSDYHLLAENANKTLVHKGNKNVCNPAKVEDHHAILPTIKKPKSLAGDDLKIYDLIVRRFLSHFYPPARSLNHTLFTVVKDEQFKTIGKETLELGWKVVYQEQKQDSKDDNKDGIAEWDSSIILLENSSVHCKEAAMKEFQTKPPRPYTEGTLLREMESAGKQIESEELREAIKDSGLGTPATRAGIIERLKKVGYIQMKGRSILITAKGEATVSLIRGAGIEVLTSPEMTGRWEQRLTEIAKGKANELIFMESVKKFTQKIVDQVSKQAAEPKMLNEKEKGGVVKYPCPRSGCKGEIIKGKKGFGCTEYRHGCRFFIWKLWKGKKLTDTMLKSLLEKGKTNKLKFKDSAGNDFFARIVLIDRSSGQLELERLE